MRERSAAPDTLVAVLEIGGTHASATVVDTATRALLAPMTRHDLDSQADTDDVLTALRRAVADARILHAEVSPDRPCWGLALPDPFDYPAGIGRYIPGEKFHALNGIALTDAILDGDQAAFLNDGDAFALGEWAVRRPRPERLVGITLGTGIGGGFITDGTIRPSDPTVPHAGRVHLLTTSDGRLLEEVMSRRALRAAYATTADGQGLDLDVRAIADRARGGESAARTVLAHGLRTLGAVLGPWLLAFAPDLVVIGGSMATSWDLFGPWFAEGIGSGAEHLSLAVSADVEASGAIGAAIHARNTHRG